MTAQEYRTMLMAVVIVIQTIVIISIAGMATIHDSPRIQDQSPYEQCMAGWKQTIADWSASTARLNKTLGVTP